MSQRLLFRKYSFSFTVEQLQAAGDAGPSTAASVSALQDAIAQITASVMRTIMSYKKSEAGDGWTKYKFFSRQDTDLGTKCVILMQPIPSVEEAHQILVSRLLPGMFVCDWNRLKDLSSFIFQAASSRIPGSLVNIAVKFQVVETDVHNGEGLPVIGPPLLKRQQARNDATIDLQQEICGICHEGMTIFDTKGIFLTHCGHAFHKTCMGPWMKFTTYTCPLCRNRSVSNRGLCY